VNLRTALSNPQQFTALGIRKLHPFDLWEVRVGLSLRLRALFFHKNDSAVYYKGAAH
jgi:hypothetical protein